ncbi:MAG: type I-MYXAN CRISPR-associated Cas8a1/Cmx1 [Planctomycetaceae bacterium]|nr:type I-MYXAN CRISPR-associated Cas8a1/Cmx1 [Planctomycetaceae bacterium]
MGRLTDDNGDTIGLSWKLSDSDMDLLERAGLAALYMTLRAAEEQVGDAKADALRKVLRWNMTHESVELRWGKPEAAKSALEALLAFAWQVRDGVLYLPAVHRDKRQRETYFLRLTEHNGVLNTFLQLEKIQPRGNGESRIEAIDDDKEFVFRFQSLAGQVLAPHKSRTISALVGKKGLKPDDVELSSWIKPGSAPRFSESEKGWCSTADLVVLLMLAPIVCLYQELQGTDRPKSDKKPWIRLKDHLYVCPDVRHLDEFDATRPDVRLDPINTSGLGDAALAFVAEYTSRSLRRESIAGCTVVAMGKVTYYGGKPGQKESNQSIRKGIVDIWTEQDTIRRYRILHRTMPSTFRPKSDVYADGSKPEVARPRGEFKVPSARGRIADNLMKRRAWYSDIAIPPRWEHHALKKQQDEIKKKENKHVSIERLWFHNLCRYQRRQLMELANEQTFWQSDQERQLHEAFRKVLWRLVEREKLAAQKRSGSRSEEDRIEDLYDDLYRRLTRAKTRDLLRRELTQIMAEPPGRFSRPKGLREHLDAIWALVNDRHDWKKAQDLALLTLASYGQFRGRSDHSNIETSEGDKA